MIPMGRWLIIPLAILLLTPTLVLTGILESVVLRWVYSLMAILSMWKWHRAMIRLEFGLSRLSSANLEIKKLVGKRLIPVFGTSITITLAVFLCVLFVPGARSANGLYLVAALIIWSSMMQIGFCNLVCHHVTITSRSTQAV